MSLKSAAAWLEGQPFAVAIAESPNLFPVIETLHVLALALVVGSIATVDLRLLGLARRQHSVATVARQALPWTWCAFLVAAVTGSLLFSSAAGRYVDNWPFRIKLILLALAALNMLVFHLGAAKTMADWDNGPTPRSAKIAGGLSLAFWVGVVVAGRWIGFVSQHHF